MQCLCGITNDALLRLEADQQWRCLNCRFLHRQQLREAQRAALRQQRAPQVQRQMALIQALLWPLACSWQEIAAAAGVSTQTVRNWLAGHSVVKPDILDCFQRLHDAQVAAIDPGILRVRRAVPCA